MENILKFTGEKSQLVFQIQADDQVRLIYAGEIVANIEHLKKACEEQPEAFSPVEVQISGEDNYHKGVKLISSAVTKRLKYVSHTLTTNELGLLVRIVQSDNKTKLTVESDYQLYIDTVAIRSWTKIRNDGTENLGIEHVSSFALTGIMQNSSYPGDFTTDTTFSEPTNKWQAELQWQERTLKEYGMDYRSDGTWREATTKRISVTNNGSWSCSEDSPSGILQRCSNHQVAMWQIEHNGSWHYEIDDAGDGRLLRLELFGPEEFDNHWWKNLEPGQQFTSVPTAFVQLSGGKDRVVWEMTKYRRDIRRENDDNKTLAVIFNDYMNGLNGDPTTEKEIPLVLAAAKAGAEYYVIDCGWYAEGEWWDSVGEWNESRTRFPNGVREITDMIRQLGMIPGLWLEIEVMGINSPLAKKLPDDWFFMRHGKRAIDVNRYHLDFRNPEVREYATSIVDKLVNEYGLGYIKMDYNIITGIGTDLNSDSVGDGLLDHNRAYLKWLDSIFEKYPDIIIENCGSGGMRHDYAMLQRHSIQSMTDQTKYDRNGQISAVSATAVTPEQSAIWSYPLPEGDDEEAIYNMVNAMLVRIHQSGYLNMLNESRFAIVQEGISVYKTFRNMIPTSLPIWPGGFPHIDDEVYSFGLLTSDGIYLAVWNASDTARTAHVELGNYVDTVNIRQIFPMIDKQVNVVVNGSDIDVEFPNGKMARLFKVTKDQKSIELYNSEYSR